MSEMEKTLKDALVRMEGELSSVLTAQGKILEE